MDNLKIQIFLLLYVIEKTAGQTTGSLRLVGQSTSSVRAGRLEVYYGGTWGTICDDSFNENSAKVACRKLGLSSDFSGYFTAGGGSGRIWLDDVVCTGSESSLSYCNRRSWGSHNCGHHEDVGVSCLTSVRGGWSSWYSWSGCSKTCGSGYRTRYRKCNSPPPTSSSFYCSGNSVSTQHCNTQACSVRGGWSSWYSWSGCSKTCGSGYRTRYRKCNNPTPSSSSYYCSGTSVSGEPCSTQHCPVNGNWGSWSLWTDCNATCGDGHRIRNRKCDNPGAKYGGTNCIGISSESTKCTGILCPVDGNWTNWSTWTSCSQTCGLGYQTRTRKCSNPPSSHGGLDCKGDNYQANDCLDRNCPVNGGWSIWQSWEECSATCGDGERIRKRNCDNPAPLYDGLQCEGITQETSNCSTKQCPVDGNWSYWSPWTSCSQTCGMGYQTRTRLCSNPSPSHGGLNCQGDIYEITNCSDRYCPVNGGWGMWQAWEECSSTCGDGERVRGRICDNPAPLYGGLQCMGITHETSNCSTKQCPVDGGWKDWSPWTSCSQTCGLGYQTRTRMCSNPSPSHGGINCQGDIYEITNCSDGYCRVNGGWGMWQAWEECSTTCGDGERIRRRNCNNPVPDYGGSQCKGINREKSNCSTKQCPVDGAWTNWSTWTSCSQTCGLGYQTKTRNCSNPPPSSGGLYCKGDYYEITHCSEQHCPVNGNWGSWSLWTDCNATCGDGHRIRNRKCYNPGAKYGGTNCIGISSESTKCTGILCPVDGNWTNWSTWTSCSQTCGLGYQTRTRKCSNPPSSHGGLDCKGDNYQANDCLDRNCPVNGGWSIWQSWEECSATCGDGERIRKRNCDNPAPLYDGLQCEGITQETSNCSTKQCPVDGNWSYWSPWTSCSQTCGMGYQTRTRMCSNPSPSHGGLYCQGDIYEITNCSDRYCPVNGGWGMWQAWEECSTTCGDGERVRGRICDNPAPMYGGLQCMGITHETSNCSTKQCPVDGGWKDWSPWTSCSQTCGLGYQTRTRMCSNPSPSHGGINCQGDIYEITNCSDGYCRVNGGWGMWQAWEECSTTCGDGERIRRRNCNNPVPDYGGSQCKGINREKSNCSTKQCPVDGNWTNWSTWTSCSQTCGLGYQTKTRDCSNPSPSHGGLYCKGDNYEITHCSEQHCPVNGGWGTWQAWEECTTTCGDGERIRRRNCNNPVPDYGGSQCQGINREKSNCSTKQCPVDGNWTNWSTWTSCSQTCGLGYQTKTRNCSNPPPSSGGSYCKGDNYEITHCSEQHCPVNGGWGIWVLWEECSTTCGDGERVRRRKCDNPIPEHGGHQCQGLNQEISNCSTKQCPVDGNWTDWSRWTSCSQTCGLGYQARTRKCNNPSPSHGGLDCKGDNYEVSNCSARNCPVNGGWGRWQAWEECSTTCGYGEHVRRRTCNDPKPMYGGKQCQGLDKETSNCSKTKCPVDGNWTNWTTWTSCSQTCGLGYQTRTRKCSNPSPSHSGLDCKGENYEVINCSDRYCPVNGGWGMWQSWEECSTTCGSGERFRRRFCNNPRPMYDGKQCQDLDKEILNCSTKQCPVDGNWTNWTTWTSCSQTCGLGYQTRTRKCSNPSPSHGGLYCKGDNYQVLNCSDRYCPVSGGWGMWQPWEECSKSCGSGERVRRRTCNNPKPIYGGKQCQGLDKETSNCSSQQCPVDGNWTDWSTWTSCSQTCGLGYQTRTRKCSNPSPSHGGLSCKGDNYEVSNCSDGYCPESSEGTWTKFPLSPAVFGGIVATLVICLVASIVIGRYIYTTKMSKGKFRPSCDQQENETKATDEHNGSRNSNCCSEEIDEDATGAGFTNELYDKYRLENQVFENKTFGLKFHDDDAN